MSYRTRERLNSALALIGILAAIVGVSLGLAALSVHNFAADCSAQHGHLTTSTWHGVPTESVCHFHE